MNNSVEKISAKCACAHNTDGSTTTLLCPVHSDTDPCARMAQVTGKRRTGTLRGGQCTHCGWTAKKKAPEPIKCDMTAECTHSATYLGVKGYVYCAEHRDYRRGVEATRPLKRWEIERIQSGKTLLGWSTTRAQTLVSDAN